MYPKYNLHNLFKYVKYDRIIAERDVFYNCSTLPIQKSDTFPSHDRCYDKHIIRKSENSSHPKIGPSTSSEYLYKMATNITFHEGSVTRAERTKLLGHPGFTIWMTGLSASGKSTIACALEQALLHNGITSYRLDGDNIRFGLNRDLGFSEAERNENIRRIGEVARLFADSGTIVVTAFIAPYKGDRDVARAVHVKDGLKFLEV